MMLKTLIRRGILGSSSTTRQNEFHDDPHGKCGFLSTSLSVNLLKLIHRSSQRPSYLGLQ